MAGLAGHKTVTAFEPCVSRQGMSGPVRWSGDGTYVKTPRYPLLHEHSLGGKYLHQASALPGGIASRSLYRPANAQGTRERRIVKMIACLGRSANFQACHDLLERPGGQHIASGTQLVVGFQQRAAGGGIQPQKFSKYAHL